jgi:transposase
MSPEEVAQAVALHGRSIRYIANLLGIPQTTVSDAIQRFRENGSYARRPGQERRRATNVVEDRFLRLQSLRERTLPATALSRRLANVHGTGISSDTVLRRLREHNLTSHPPATAPRLNARHRRQRLEFARTHADWDMDEGRRVLFTDESRFTRYLPDRRQRGFRRPGERYAQCCFASRVPFGGGGVMIWGGICLAASQVMRRGSGALSPATHAHSTSHSQTYTTTFIHPWATFPDGTRTRADLAVVAERVLILPSTTLPSAPRRHTYIHTYLHDIGIQVLRWPPVAARQGRQGRRRLPAVRIKLNFFICNYIYLKIYQYIFIQVFLLY